MTKTEKIAQQLNKEIDRKIEQQQILLENTEVDLEVAKKLDDQHRAKRSEKRIKNIKARIKELEDKKE